MNAPERFPGGGGGRRGRIVGPFGCRFFGNRLRYEPMESYGLLAQGARVILLSDGYSLDELGLPIVLVIILEDRFASSVGRIGWVELRHTDFEDVPPLQLPPFDPPSIGRLRVKSREQGHFRRLRDPFLQPDATGRSPFESREMETAGAAFTLLDDQIRRDVFGTRLIHVETEPVPRRGWVELSATSFHRTPIEPVGSPETLPDRVGEVGYVVGFFGTTLRGDALRCRTDRYEGRLERGARIALRASTRSVNAYGIPMIPVRILDDRGRGREGLEGWISLTDTDIMSLPPAGLPDFEPPRRPMHGNSARDGRVIAKAGEQLWPRPSAYALDDDALINAPSGTPLHLKEPVLFTDYFDRTLIHVEILPGGDDLRLEGEDGWIELQATSFAS